MRATFTASIPASALTPRDPRAVFQTVLMAKVYPVGQQIISTARASTKHQGVAQAYQLGASVAGNKVTVWAINEHPLYKIIEEPTKPHVIEPKRAGGVLAFPIGGQMVFTRRVMHPGTPGAFNLRNAFQAHRTDTERAIQEGVGEYLRQSLGGG